MPLSAHSVALIVLSLHFMAVPSHIYAMIVHPAVITSFPSKITRLETSVAIPIVVTLLRRMWKTVNVAEQNVFP